MRTEDVYEAVTNQIIELLEKGTIPWRQSWSGGFPMNLVAGKSYCGINAFLLGFQPYPKSFWVTAKQAQRKKGKIKDGEIKKPAHVIFCRGGYRRHIPMPGGLMIRNHGAFAKMYQVYNVDQTEGLERLTAEYLHKPVVLQHPAAIIDAMPDRPDTRHGRMACYSPVMDRVVVPPPEHFHQAEEYYSTLFHELIHSTGSESRLNRPDLTKKTKFGDHAYSREELVAEMGSPMLCAISGIEKATIENSAAYVREWLKKLKDDARLIVQAGFLAQRASNFILGKHKVEKNKKTEAERVESPDVRLRKAS